MPSEPETFANVLSRHDPDAWTAPLGRREDAGLPFDPTGIPAGLPVMLDTGFYIDRLKNKIPAPVLAFVEERTVVHSAVAMGEMAIGVDAVEAGVCLVNANAGDMDLLRPEPQAVVLPCRPLPATSVPVTEPAAPL